MPAQAHQDNFNQDFLDFEAFQSDPKRKQSPSRRAQAKNRRRHDRHGEESSSASPFKTQDQEITGKPLQKRAGDSAFTSHIDLASKLDPSLESFDDHSKVPPLKSSPHATTEPHQVPQHGYSRSLSNRHNVAGSPPVLSTYKGSLSPPVSPRVPYRSLVSHNQGYSGGAAFPGLSPPHRDLRTAYSPSDPRPPLPHMDQPHFYGAPELQIGRGTRTKSTESMRNGFCALDCVAVGTPGGGFAQCEALLSSRTNELDVFQLSKTKLGLISTLRNLRGSVVDAKTIVGVEAGNTKVEQDAYIVMVVHGPATAGDDLQVDDGRGEGFDDFAATQSMMQALEVASSNQYQTTVEVYSMVDAKHVTTLFKSPKEYQDSPPKLNNDGCVSSIGKLSVQVAGRFITINSGSSGEVFIYQVEHLSDQNSQPAFTCIGKTWTALSFRQTRSHSMSSKESGRSREDEGQTGTDDLAITALSARFLATVSPGPSNGIGCHGHISGVIDNGRIPGLSSHSPPEVPHVTCQVETLNEESLLNRVARDATQEFVKGAKWVGNQGVAAWNYYWTKPTSNDQQIPPGSSPATEAHVQFPPTHAHDNGNTRSRYGPAVVSILDLENLAQNQNQKDAMALQPIAAFTISSGCSAMSFSPQGVQLFTASAKGDVQQVWDLMRMASSGIAPGSGQDDNAKLATIREIAKFTRITEARIIDIAWLHPNGDKFAIATEKGTVHTFELSPSAFRWPPLRRVQRLNTVRASDQIQKDSNDALPSSTKRSNVGLGSAFGLLSGTAQPLLSAVRGRTMNPASTLPNLGTITSTAGVGAKSGKAVAAGFNRSLTAAASGTVNSIRHFGENRISLPGRSRTRLARCMVWMGGGQETSLAVTASSSVRIHAIRPGGVSRDGKRRPSAVGSKPMELVIPEHPQIEEAQRIFWTSSQTRVPFNAKTSESNPLSFAEIETHAPYQPFHTDRRVGFSIYDEALLQADPHHLDSNEPWAFGDNIPSRRLHSVPGGGADEELEDGQLQPLEMENVVQRQGEGATEEIMVTTRRKKGRKSDENKAEEDKDFFEDEMEVVDFAQRRV